LRGIESGRFKARMAKYVLFVAKNGERIFGGGAVSAHDPAEFQTDGLIQECYALE
jgi:hypothetical protein